jgi:serine/threonine-protein kinase
MAALLLAGRYRLQDILSSTPMAEVWLADDTELDRQVVVKLLTPGADRGRFEREARAVAALSHPHIVRLFDFGDERRLYMIFEYLTGGSLEDRLSGSRALPGDEVERVAKGVAEGLAHGHEHGVVHRDLKPANILFDAEGRAKIADFGIARVQGLDTLTDAGTVLGTASYISPEQVRGEPATPASDIYSFGVVLYRMLAGRLPFEAESPTALAVLHRDREAPPLETVGDRGLAAIATSALAKEPALRPADGAALLALLEGAPVADDGTATLVLSPPRRNARRRLPLAAGFSAVLLAGCGVLAALLLTNHPASAPAVPPRAPQPTSSAVRSTAPDTGTATARTSTSQETRTARTTSTRPATTTSTPAPTEPSTPLTTELTATETTTAPLP